MQAISTLFSFIAAPNSSIFCTNPPRRLAMKNMESTVVGMTMRADGCTLQCVERETDSRGRSLVTTGMGISLISVSCVQLRRCSLLDDDDKVWL